MAIVSQLIALLTPELLAVLGPVVAAVVGMVLRSIWKDQAARKAQLLEFGIEIAYACVSEVAKRTQTKIDDKIALGLDYLRKWLSANGQELQPVDEAKAKLLFQAMHDKELRALGR